MAGNKEFIYWAKNPVHENVLHKFILGGNVASNSLLCCNQMYYIFADIVISATYNYDKGKENISDTSSRQFKDLECDLCDKVSLVVDDPLAL